MVSLIVVCRDRVSRLIVTLGGGGGGGGGCSPTSVSQLFDVLWAEIFRDRSRGGQGSNIALHGI